MDRIGERATVPAALDAAARRFGDREALVDGPVRLGFGELRESARDCARALLARGIGAGDRVAIWSPNTHHWVRAALGALCAGAVLVPINTRFTGAEARDVLARSRARALVVAGPFLGQDRLSSVREAAGDGPGGPVPGLPELRTVLRVPVEDAVAAEAGVLRWDDVPALAAAVPGSAVDDRIAALSPDHVSDVLFTSGTTGRSKGAMSAHRQALAVADAWAERTGLTEADRYLVINPFFHSFGYKAGILAALLRGATVVPQRTFDAGAALRLIAAERITVLPGAPTIYQVLLDHPDRHRHDLGSLRIAVTGAATVPVALVRRMRRELAFEHVLTAYGLTEAVVATMCHRDDEPDAVARTSGRPAAGFEVRVVDPDGRPLGPGEPGEVLLRGPNVMLGYLDDPAATAAAIDDRGWLRTGDAGVLDEAGYLSITDRIKDMYICGGFNVYPAEVEQVLARLPGIADAAVVGAPDARLGEVGKAYLVRRGGAEPSATEVIAHCREHLANFKVPRQVEFVEALPRNAAGKVLKQRLGGQATNGEEHG
ncbi:FadD3 family acyl-CoA ligase [Saccharopolyspora sp. CA-218241]|uniref:FadD3 family acyl-CoA ligase n=1 Tax=Saccharopolyspora sp. CA-218241 TaxID=3240027 RepID=UPI003D97E655